MSETRELEIAQPAELTTGDTFLAVIAAAARDPQVDVSKMEALLAMRERLLQKEAEAAYNQAMALMQPRLPRVKKNGTIDLGKGKPIPFAKWEDIDAVLRPILSEHGFSLSFPTRLDNGQLIMACVVSHISGHSERSEAAVMPDAGPGRNSTQAMGSGRSYCKRYLTLDMINIVTEGQDDDAQSLGYLTEQQAKNVQDMMLACELDAEETARFLKFAGAKSIEEMRSQDYERLMVALRKMEKHKKEGRA